MTHLLKRWRNNIPVGGGKGDSGPFPYARSAAIMPPADSIFLALSLSIPSPSGPIDQRTEPAPLPLRSKSMDRFSSFLDFLRSRCSVVAIFLSICLSS